MKFEFDKDKSTSNKLKHGIDFVEAQALWKSPVIELRSKNPGEPRLLVIGKIREKFWTAIITRRQGAIRLISVRRSRDEEKHLYL
jgi:uncharacterized DUF497 family protein